MQFSHLSLQEARLTAGSEWSPHQLDWCFMRVVEGEGYWIDKVEPRELGKQGTPDNFSNE
ncbi:MAG: hypothetical protein ACK4UN_20040, partial [Limisphaerales bacterium]